MNARDVDRQLNPNRFLTAAEVLALPPDNTRRLWDKTVPASQSSILVAKPKIGKSTLAANLCLAIARGVPFLGRDTQKCPVAYISLDATLTETLEIFQEFGMKPDDTVFFYSEAMPQIPSQWLMQQIREHGIRFAVVDTVQRFFRFQDTNAY